MNIDDLVEYWNDNPAPERYKIPKTDRICLKNRVSPQSMLKLFNYLFFEKFEYSKKNNFFHEEKQEQPLNLLSSKTYTIKHDRLKNSIELVFTYNTKLYYKYKFNATINSEIEKAKDDNVYIQQPLLPRVNYLNKEHLNEIRALIIYLHNKQFISNFNINKASLLISFSFQTSDKKNNSFESNRKFFQKYKIKDNKFTQPELQFLKPHIINSYLK